MTLEILHWVSLLTATGIAFIYFRDLGDVTQALLHVTRENMLFAIRHERTLLASAISALLLASGLHFWADVGSAGIFYALLVADIIMIGFPWLWVHVGLRNQQHTARHYSIDEAKRWVRAEDSVIVIENNGEARAYPDAHIKRPHLAGTPEGLGGENVIMTYCCMSHLGLGYKPEIDGAPLELEVLAQHGNNLIMKDLTTGEPIQQVYGSRECDGQEASGMRPWPTFRMSLRGFERAYPAGKVFLNPIVSFRKNPLLCIFDHLVEAVFLWGTVPHHTSEKLLFETMSVEDDRLPRKAITWGFTVGHESVAYTLEFVRDHKNLINTRVGGRDVVIAYDEDFESVGVYYNDTGAPVESIDFFGQSDRGKLERVETVNAGVYWCVWVNFFPTTDVNRVASVTSTPIAA